MTPSASAAVAMTTTDIAGNGLEPNVSRSSSEGGVLIQYYKSWGWGHTSCNCPSQLNFTRGAIKWCHTPRQQEVGTTNHPAKSTVIKQGVHGRQNHNPDPIVRLIGEVNEATVLIDEVQTTALVDSEAQMSAMTDSFT